MLVYHYKSLMETFTTCNDDAPNPMKSDTDREFAHDFVYYELQYELKKLYGEDYKGKRMLDVGMGNGNA